MGHQGIEVSALNFFCQFQMLLGHFEEDLYIPAFAVTVAGIINQLSISRYLAWTPAVNNLLTMASRFSGALTIASCRRCQAQHLLSIDLRFSQSRFLASAPLLSNYHISLQY
jgi:hypothetical protein